MQQLFIILAMLGLFASPQDSKTKRQQAAAQFQHVKSIIESNRFKIAFTIATTHRNYYMGQGEPYLDDNIRIDSDSSYIIINDTLASGRLPYYGTGYAFPKTGDKGIVFDDKIENKITQTKGKGRKQTIIYEFTVPGKNDHYQIMMKIDGDGTCYLYVNSTQHGSSSYTGMLVYNK